MSRLDPQAGQLNQAIRTANPAVYRMLSRRGKAIFFPKLGILSQSAEAKGKAINATIGTALEDDGHIMCLPSLAAQVKLDKDAVFAYAPSPGLPTIRAKWGKMLLEKNPGLAGKTFSQPLVTCALTHGISLSGYLFCDTRTPVVTPDLYWENYDLLLGVAYGAELVKFPTFTASGGFNIEGLRAAILAQSSKRVVVSLNFPNNPTGYTPLASEVPRIKAVLVEAAEAGKDLVVVVDDAYFGLVFEDGVYTQSIFADLCDAHERILAVKLDGPTKEDYVWGFRVGFITFGVKGGTPALYQALEGKCGGAVRGTISNASMQGQSMLLAAYESPSYGAEKRQKFEALKGRYRRIREILAAHPEYAAEFAPLPFNSGYFMCVQPLGVEAEAVRQKLLAEYSTGVIALGPVLRLAFSATPLARLDQLFANLYAACRSVRGGSTPRAG